MRPHSVVRRISISFGLLSACVLLVLGGFLYRSLAEHVDQSDTADAIGKVKLLRHILSGFASTDDISRDPQRLQDLLIGHPDLIVHMQDTSGRTVFGAAQDVSVPGHHGADLNPDALPAVATWSHNDGRQFRIVSMRAKVGRDSELVTVLLGLDVSEHARIVRRYLETTIAALTSAILAATFLGWWVAKREIRVVKHIAETARTVSSSQLGARLEITNAPIELRELVAAFNGMLDRLQESFARLSQFSSDLAHEIRTPIHNLMVQSHVALNTQRPANEYRQALEANTEELERLAHMVEDMLFLAKADRAQTALNRERFDLREELDKVSAYFEALAEEHQVRLQCEGHAVTKADRRLVERVIGNLLSNAVRYGKAGTIVSATVRSIGSSAHLSITNIGPGIPQEMQSRVFDRFFQANPLRSDKGASWGLGLAIVKSIMELHGGSISVQSGLDGPTTFTAAFPGPALNSADA